MKLRVGERDKTRLSPPRRRQETGGGDYRVARPAALRHSHSVDLEAVRQYYLRFDRSEWTRLERPEGSVEFAVNTHFLAQHLPQRGRVLDLGGGPGRYASWLAERGHRVTLADLSPNLLDIARAELNSALVEDIVEAGPYST